MSVIRRVKGHRTDDDGAMISLMVETSNGEDAKLEIMPEAAMEMILALINTQTEAEIRAQGGVESDKSFGTQPIPASKIAVARHRDPSMQLVQIMTARGGVIEFEVVDSAVPWRIGSAKE